MTTKNAHDIVRLSVSAERVLYSYFIKYSGIYLFILFCFQGYFYSDKISFNEEYSNALNMVKQKYVCQLSIEL